MDSTQTVRRPEIIGKEIFELQEELRQSQKHYKIPPKDERLRIPTRFKEFFPGGDFYEDMSSKLIWEETFMKICLANLFGKRIF